MYCTLRIGDSFTRFLISYRIFQANVSYFYGVMIFIWKLMANIVCRKDFPILNRTIHGKPLVYLDNAATSQKPSQVIGAISNFYENFNANVHRATHLLSAEASSAWHDARCAVASFINAKDEREIVFTRNTTESLNLIARGLIESRVSNGDEILVTALEHHSNFVVWQQLGKRIGANLKVCPVNKDGTVSVKDFKNQIGARTKIASFSHSSNVFGTILPVTALTRIAKEAGAVVVIDGAQAIPHFKVDVQSLNCDAYAFSAHKMLGPTGIGVLWVRRELLEKLEPLLFGGDMISEVSIEDTTFNDIPYRFEAGTPDIAGGVGIKAAIDYLSNIGMDRVQAHNQELMNYTIQSLSEMSGITLYGQGVGEKDRIGVISFNLEGAHPHDVSTLLDSFGIAVRSGDHCCQPLMSFLGIPGTIRASLQIYNNFQDIDELVMAIRRIRDFIL